MFTVNAQGLRAQVSVPRGPPGTIHSVYTYIESSEREREREIVETRSISLLQSLHYIDKIKRNGVCFSEVHK